VENGYLNAEGEAALLALEHLLNSPTDDKGLRPWTDWDAVVDSHAWGQIRVLAAQAFELLRIYPEA
jgi:DNA mismatch repair protein MutH